MDITKTLATISAMRTKAIIQNKDRVVGLLDQLVVTAVAISKLSESVYSEDYRSPKYKLSIFFLP